MGALQSWSSFLRIAATFSSYSGLCNSMVPFAMPSRRCRMPATRSTWSAEAIFEIPIRTGEAILDLVDGNEENSYLNRCSLPRLKSREAGQGGGGAF
jgi:hypothetical protein